jgi:hypothetical protein
MRWIRKVAGLCAALGCAGPGVAAAGETWHEIEANGYTVLSQLEERDTRHWTAFFDQFVAAVTSTLNLRDAQLPPLTVVLFEHEADLLAAAPAQSLGCDAKPDAPHVLAFAADAPDEAASRALFHAAAHWATAPVAEREPAWFVEGVAQLFSTFGIKGMEAHFGDSLAGAAALLRERGTIPMEAFLAGTADHAADADRYHAQALVVAHWLLFGRADPLHPHLASAPAAADAALLEYVERPDLGRAMRPRQISEQRYLMSRASPARLGHALALLGAPEARPVQAFNAP